MHYAVSVRHTVHIHTPSSYVLCMHVWGIIPHCSLRDSSLTDTGAIALAKALEQNESLKELK